LTIAVTHSCSNRVMTCSGFSEAGAADIVEADGAVVGPPLHDASEKIHARTAIVHSERLIVASFLCCATAAAL
jgi:hypothetical protein